MMFLIALKFKMHFISQAERTMFSVVEQTMWLVDSKNKLALLKHVLADDAVGRTIIFTRTKKRADRLENKLKKLDIEADAIHSDRSQRQRERSISKFRDIVDRSSRPRCS